MYSFIGHLNTFCFVITPGRKDEKGEVKREKIAGKLKDVVCRCQTAKAEETYVEC